MNLSTEANIGNSLNSQDVFDTINNNINKSRFNFLKDFDFFGVSFDFRMANSSKFVSKTGGLWFVIYIILMVILSVVWIFYYIKNNSFHVESFFKHLADKKIEDKNFIGCC